MYINSTFSGPNRLSRSHFVKANGQTVLTMQDGNHLHELNTLFYTFADHLGSTCTLMEAGGHIISREYHTPFGETPYSSTSRARYRYCGKEKDSESGLYYYGARYYAAWTCRFVSVDPLAEEYAQLSSYNYADNSPVTDLDLDGLQGTGTEKSAQGASEPTYSGKAVDKSDNNNWKIIDVHNLTEKQMKAKNLQTSFNEIEVLDTEVGFGIPNSPSKRGEKFNYDLIFGYAHRSTGGGGGGGNLPSAKYTEVLVDFLAFFPSIAPSGSDWAKFVNNIIELFQAVKDVFPKQTEQVLKSIESSVNSVFKKASGYPFANVTVTNPQISAVDTVTTTDSTIVSKPSSIEDPYDFQSYSIQDGDSTITRTIKGLDTAYYKTQGIPAVPNDSTKVSSAKYKSKFNGK